VSYLDTFYGIAYKRPASTLEYAHISVTCNMHLLDVWLHWSELNNAGIATYYMKSISSCILRNVDDLKKTRALLWNVMDYPLGCPAKITERRTRSVPNRVS
jgi:hypothetical protein